jgi:hypothetical protein
MKKILIAAVMLFMSNFVSAQNDSGSVGLVTVINQPAAAYLEAGINYNFTFEFKVTNFDYTSINSNGSSTFTAVSYKIMSSLVYASDSDFNNSGSDSVSGSLVSQTIRNMGTSTTISAQIKWNGNSNSNPSLVGANALIRLYSNSGSFIDRFISLGTGGNWSGIGNGKLINIATVKAPTIISSPFLKCCSSLVTIYASDSDFADVFDWNVTGATIVSGLGTNVISVSQNQNSTQNIIATCTVRRLSGLPTYTRTSSNSFSKLDRTANFIATPDLSYICLNNNVKTVTMDDQCGISSVVWTAPNCTISAETIANGKRTRTITPNANTVAGATITMFATVNFVSGCSAVTPTKSFVYYTNAAPPMPIGRVEFPLTTYVDQNNVVQCMNPDKINPIFIQNQDINGNPINPNYVFNGETTVSPGLVLVRQIPCGGNYTPIQYNYTVCNVNPCTGVKACKVFRQNGPVCVAPCYNLKNAATNEKQKEVIAPNPSEGNFSISLTEKSTGEYQIFNSYGFQIQEGKFNDTNAVDVKFVEGLKADIYLINVVVGNQIYSEKIILKK